MSSHIFVSNWKALEGTRTLRTAMHIFEGVQTFREKPRQNFALHLAFEDLDRASYGALAVSGGWVPGTVQFHTPVIVMAKQLAEADNPIAAVCHGLSHSDSA